MDSVLCGSRDAVATNSGETGSGGGETGSGGGETGSGDGSGEANGRGGGDTGGGIGGGGGALQGDGIQSELWALRLNARCVGQTVKNLHQSGYKLHPQWYELIESAPSSLSPLNR